MPATLLKNMLTSSSYYGLYLNPNGNNSRIFFNSTDEAKRLIAHLNEQKITHTTDESGASFLALLKDAKAKNGGSKEDLEAMELEYAEMKKCPIVIKILGNHNLYKVSLLLPYKEISVKAFYQMLLVAVKYKKDMLQTRAAFRQQMSTDPLAAVEELKKQMASIQTSKGVTTEHQDFLRYAFEKGELSFDDINTLALNAAEMRSALSESTSAHTADQPMSEMQRLLGQLSASMGQALGSSAAFADEIAKAADKSFGLGKKR